MSDAATAERLGWEDLVATALVGTERRPLPEPALAGTDAVEQAAAAAGGAGGLLGAAAVLTIARQAGEIPPRAAEEPASPAAEDGRPTLSSGACGALLTILADPTYRVFLEEWLALAATSGRRLPPELVPALLDAPRASAGANRPLVAAVAGPLGPWLAERNPEWRWAHTAAATGLDAAAPADADALAARWRDSDAGDERRLDAFRRLRLLDPVSAREAAEATWRTDPSPVRAGMVRAMREGLGSEDEPFLERALEDGRKDVRAAAAALLRALPESRLAARIAAKAVPLLSVEGVGRRRLAIRLPADPSPEEAAALARDGIDVRGVARGRDRWWLARQLVAATPLEAWRAALRRDPPALVDLAAASGAPELLDAWALAAISQRRSDWARALLRAGVAGGDEDGTTLLDLLPREEAETVVAGALRRDGITTRTIALLERLSPPWTPALSETAVESLAGEVASRDLARGRAAVRGLGSLLNLHPSVADPAAQRLAAALGEQPDPVARLWRAPLATFLSLLAFRRSLHEEMR